MEIFCKDYHQNHFKHIEQPTLFYRGKGILSMQYHSIDYKQPFENGIVKIWFSYHSKHCLMGKSLLMQTLLYEQALNTYKAIHGTEPEHKPYKDASHAPSGALIQN